MRLVRVLLWVSNPIIYNSGSEVTNTSRIGLRHWFKKLVNVAMLLKTLSIAKGIPQILITSGGKMKWKNLIVSTPF